MLHCVRIIYPSKVQSEDQRTWMCLGLSDRVLPPGEQRNKLETNQNQNRIPSRAQWLLYVPLVSTLRTTFTALFIISHEDAG